MHFNDTGPILLQSQALSYKIIQAERSFVFPVHDLTTNRPRCDFFTQSFVQGQIKENIKAPRH